MGFLGYSFIDLNDDQKHARRLALDHYAWIAQISAIVILARLQVLFFIAWLSKRFSKGDKESRPGSPYVKAELENEKIGLKSKVKIFSRKARWWTGGEVAAGWGKRGEWLLGAVWMTLLLVFCVVETGEDYMHLTKRFGIVAASQLPLHYLLAMKYSYSPLQFLTRMSHEQLNRVHQILGRIIQILLTMHAVFYLNFFILIKVLAKRIRDRDVILGVTCILIITAISSTALARVRAWNYRLFYVVHAVGATIFLPLAYFHVHHIRPFILQSAVIYAANIALRFFQTDTHKATISLVPKTNLVQINVPLPGLSTRQRFKPGQHVYFSLPAGYHDSNVPSMLLRNPFTVASLPRQDGQLVLVARALSGTTKSLAALASSSDFKPRSLPVKIEGPYGIPSDVASLKGFDRVLLVAGGVGATFIVPIWRELLRAKEDGGQLLHTSVRLAWAVRELSETSWALPLSKPASDEAPAEASLESEIYVTGAASGALANWSSNTMELTETDTLADAEQQKAWSEQGVAIKHHRLDLREVTDETFNGTVGRVAVLVCGPAGMWRQLRQEVGRYVRRGTDVYFHAEEFGL